MSTLQFEEVNNDGSNTGHNDKIDGPLSRLLLRQNKALMRMARNRAWRMAIMNQTPFEKELPKALKEVISKLGAELRKRKDVRHGQIKSEMEESIETSFNIGEGEKNTETEIAEIKSESINNENITQ
uniref:Uncharacterized protein n=1 Tax=Bactrocera latifrons TaxID=174628 RepID=A0A0K8UYV9_BACLA